MKTRSFDFGGRSLRSQFSAAKRREDLAKIITYAYYGKHISDLPSPATLAETGSPEKLPLITIPAQ